MKRLKYIIITLILWIIACFCIGMGILKKNHTISGNRYGSIEAYKDTVYFYANGNIYSYNGKGTPELYKKNEGFHFDIYKNCIYYGSGKNIYGFNLETGEKVFTYEINENNAEDIYLYGILDGIIKMEYYTKNPHNTYSRKELYLNVEDGSVVENVEDKDWYHVDNDKEYDEYKKYVSIDVDAALTDQDILYVRMVSGDSYISSYQINRDDNGKIIGADLLQKIVPASKIDDTMTIILYILGGIFIIGGIVTLIVMRKYE